MAIPNDLLLAFFIQATAALNEYTGSAGGNGNTGAVTEPPPPLAEQRHLLLGVQRSTLKEVLTQYNDEWGSTFSMEQVEAKLRDLGSGAPKELKETMEAMNDAARLAFCRLVLQAECDWDAQANMPVRQLRNRDDGPMERSAIIEFCGLCSAAVRLPNVQKHLRDGTALCGTSHQSINSNEERSEIQSPILLQKRLDQIQRLFLRAVGYEPECASSEIRQMFLASDGSDSSRVFAHDAELHEIFAKCASSMTVAVTNASFQDDTPKLSDQDEGGVTRVVGVQYSEKMVTPSSPGNWESAACSQHHTMGAPSVESIQEQVEERQQQELELARQAAAMQQGILADLLSMDEQDREANLQLAKEAHDEFLKGALELPAGPERIQYLRLVDPETQRLLVMHKLWANMLANNGGVPPTIRHS